MEQHNEMEYMDVAEQRAEEMPKVKELLQILIETNQEQAAQSVAFLMDFMDNLDEQFESVNQELQGVKQELKDLQKQTESKSIRNRMAVMLGGLENKVNLLQERLKEMKTALNEKASQVVDNFKRHGISALNNVTEALGIKDTLSFFKGTFENGISAMTHSIERIDDLEQRYRQAFLHVKNAGRAIRGKETEKEVQYPKRNVFTAMRNPYQSMKNIYAAGLSETTHALSKVERLETMAGQKENGKEKQSISQKLKQFKEAQGKQEEKQAAKQKGQEYGR